MLRLQQVLTIMISVMFVYQISSAKADSVTLENGSNFEGTIIEDTGSSLRMKLGIGIVDFPKEEIVEVIDVPEEEESFAEESVVMSTAESDQVSAADEEEDVTGKVKYQGKWVSQDVYDVIRKEQEIKEKRHLFLQEKRKKQEGMQRQNAEAQLRRQQKEAEKKNLNITGPKNRFSEFKSFGQSKSGLQTRSFGEIKADAGDKSADDEDSTFGRSRTQTYATSSNPYAKKGN